MLTNNTVLTQASRQWSSRPADERFTSLLDMRDHMATIRERSRNVIVPSRRIEVRPTADDKGLEIWGPNGVGYSPTHYAFGQLAQRAEAPAGYLRKLPAPMAADAINYGLQFLRQSDDVGVLLYKNGADMARAVTGPKYGRIWNLDVVNPLIDHVGDGVSGDWRVPGEFGRAINVNRDNTTLFAGDRDMFIFLADETRRIEIPNRRNGESGSLARGFFVWNSEVGAQTFGIATFLFDYVCSNRIVWGAAEYKEIRIRHSSNAPDRFFSEIAPALRTYTESSDRRVIETITAAQDRRIGDADAVSEFLARRFGPRRVQAIQAAHTLEEGRPVSTLWDAVTGATAVARGIQWQDERVELEREAGKILELVAA
jgi:hypothetical protein